MTRPVRRPARRPDIDRSAVRYFVYFLCASNGKAIYVGRSCDVAKRLRSHHADARHRFDAVKASKAAWFFTVRSVKVEGPYTWDRAVAEERAAIERCQPVGNISLTARDHRPGVARRSAAVGGAA